MIYADFESILVPEDTGNQYPEEPYTNKYQQHVACSYGYKLASVDDTFCKTFKSYISEDAVYQFINSMIKEIKYLQKKHFKKKLVMTREDDGDFENSIKC